MDARGETHPEATAEGRALATFACLWASATVFHLASYDQWALTPGHFALLVAAGGVLARPAAPRRLLVLAALQVFEVLVMSPQVSNHWLFTGFVNLTWIVVFVGSAVARRRWDAPAGELYRQFAPLARLELLILYLFVVLHKLNWDFFDPEVSCGARFYFAQAERFGVLPRSPGLALACAWLTIVTEATIPLLLVFPRTRLGGVILGAVFHWLIGLNPISGFYNFSSMLLAVFVLFAPASFLAEALRRLGDALAGRGARPFAGLSFAARGVLAAALTAGALGLLGLLMMTYRGDRDFFVLLWGVYGGGLTFALGAAAWRGRGRFVPEARALAPPRPALWAFPALVFLNGLSPYLGLKTETAFAMYSNLRTEGGRTNHLFIPTATQVFGFQRDVVEVLESSDPDLARLGERGEVLPWLAFRELTSRRPRASVVFVRGGRVERARRISARPELALSPPWWSRKLLPFRAVPKTGPQPCEH